MRTGAAVWLALLFLPTKQQDSAAVDEANTNDTIAILTAANTTANVTGTTANASDASAGANANATVKMHPVFGGACNASFSLKGPARLVDAIFPALHAAFAKDVAAFCPGPEEEAAWCWEYGSGGLYSVNGTDQGLKFMLRACPELLLNKPLWAFLPRLADAEDECWALRFGEKILNKSIPLDSGSGPVFHILLNGSAAGATFLTPSTLDFYCVNYGDSLPDFAEAIAWTLLLAIPALALASLAFAFQNWIYLIGAALLPCLDDADLVLHDNRVPDAAILKWANANAESDVIEDIKSARHDLRYQDPDLYDFFGWPKDGVVKKEAGSGGKGGLRGLAIRLLSRLYEWVTGQAPATQGIPFPAPRKHHEPDSGPTLKRFLKPASLASLGLSHHAVATAADTEMSALDTMADVKSSVFQTTGAASAASGAPSGSASKTRVSKSVLSANAPKPSPRSDSALLTVQSNKDAPATDATNLN